MLQLVSCFFFSAFTRKELVNWLDVVIFLNTLRQTDSTLERVFELLCMHLTKCLFQVFLQSNELIVV